MKGERQMKILQIMPLPSSIPSSATLKLPPYGQQFRYVLYEQHLIGMALVEYSNGTTAIEWVTWIPNSREITITNGYFTDSVEWN